MQPIIIAIGMACLFTAFLTITNLPKWIDFKPFNCAICLSFWSTLMAQALALPDGIYNIDTPTMFIPYAGISAYSAIILKRVIYKI
jgi:hypothetical protein